MVSSFHEIAPTASADRLAAPPVSLATDEEVLAARIEQLVRRETLGGVRDLRVKVDKDGVLLAGRCFTYYCKQLAQQAAMKLIDGESLTNDIEVR